MLVTENALSRTRIGVIGAGQMGCGIAEVCARAVDDVLVYEPGTDRIAAGRRRIEASLERAVTRGNVTAADAERALHSLRFTTELDAFADRDLVVEAIAEDESAKRELFGMLDKIVQSPDATLASNTSSIPIMTLAMATERPSHVLGFHFFNPVPVLDLVELVPSMLTSPEVEQRARDFATTALNKTVIRSQDRAGFVVNALLVPYMLAAIRMVESGFATAEDIDAGMVLGCAHPMGPLHLADLIGLDTVNAIAAAMYEEFKEPLYSAPPQLLRMVDAGLLGRKSGRGLFEYGS
jgi:3-hydroxybutyryl-CoA dehydrogenase